MLPNLTDYKTKSEKELVSIQFIDGKNFAIVTKKFSPDDGSELASEVAGITMEEVDKTITDKKAEIKGLELFKADLELAK